MVSPPQFVTASQTHVWVLLVTLIDETLSFALSGCQAQTLHHTSKAYTSKAYDGSPACSSRLGCALGRPRSRKTAL